MPANIAFVKHIFKQFSRKATKCASLCYISEIQTFYFENSHLRRLWTASVFLIGGITIRGEELFFGFEFAECLVVALAEEDEAFAVEMGLVGIAGEVL